MSRKTKRFAVLAIVILVVVVGWGGLFNRPPQEWVTATDQGALIRLHILANSDDACDQALKLKVRDAVVEYLAPLLNEADTVDAARRIVSARREDLARIAANVLAANGVTYPVTVEMGRFEFPLRAYGPLVLPSGEYEAVRILLGEAKGKNWWCVLFPPLCVVDAANAVAAPDGTVGDRTPGGCRIELRWKVAELWNRPQE